MDRSIFRFVVSVLASAIASLLDSVGAWAKAGLGRTSAETAKDDTSIKLLMGDFMMPNA